MKEALKLVLEALQDYVDEYGPWREDSGAQYALRVGKEALAQPEQEPVAWRLKNKDFSYQVTSYCKEQADTDIENGWELIEVLYRFPPQRKPLTDEQMNQIWLEQNKTHGSVIWRFARAIEAAHGIRSSDFKE